jgi:hypothetical protein
VQAPLKNSLAALIGSEQLLEALSQARITVAGIVKIRLPIGRVRLLKSRVTKVPPENPIF